MARKLAIAKQDRLAQLAKSIQDSHEAIMGLARSVEQKSREALAEAILVGEKLIEAKGILGHGHFSKWLEISTPDIGRSTVANYMAISRANRAGKLVGANGLHHAYQLLREANEEPKRLPAPQVQPEVTAPPPEVIEPEVMPAEPPAQATESAPQTDAVSVEAEPIYEPPQETVTCPSCHGTTGHHDSDGRFSIPCHTCGSTGRVTAAMPMPEPSLLDLMTTVLSRIESEVNSGRMSIEIAERATLGRLKEWFESRMEESMRF